MSEHSHMLTQSAGGAATVRRPAKAGLDATVEKIRTLLGAGEYLAARELARRAVQRFPEDAEILRLASIFERRNKARAVPDGPRQPDRSKEFEWLRHPPQWASGKWVALLGSDVIAADESLDEVERILQATELPGRPLLHKIA